MKSLCTRNGVVFDGAVAVTIAPMIAASVQHADATCGAPIVVAKEQAFSSDGERNKTHSRTIPVNFIWKLFY
ncbi:uncharacterized protein TNCV_3074161 [Trichonephila clavipes]|uniref:Uncharacterized protein n=1 Tax=Trichonephila clavipes TaxID=2585209 RepID=A0A8X6SIJ7_TRICX|nr:uncharacterized protein TNCV_3074161 [Trichonephila clavipes]